MSGNAKKIDEQYMQRALSLAVRGTGSTAPNPMVGCVLVRNTHDTNIKNIKIEEIASLPNIIGEGWHHKCGEPHAEVEALTDAVNKGNKDSIRGATAYVTLEPCCHQGRTPPCAQRLVKEGVSRVVVATTDPNPKVAGGGLAVLREAGIEVVTSCLEQEARWLNRGFIRVQTLGRPWVLLKAAASLDGRMALSNGDSKWITSAESRTLAHSMRASHDAILVGVGTVLHDNPELTVRLAEGRNPKRVILDASLRTPPDAKVVRGEGGCIIFASAEDFNNERAARLRDAGAKIIAVNTVNANKTGTAELDIKAILSALVNEGILSLMVEGGPRVSTSFMKAGLADELALFIAPRVLGEGIGLGTGMSLSSVRDSINLQEGTVKVRSVKAGGDVLLEGRFACSPDL